MVDEPGVVVHLWSAQAGGAVFGVSYADRPSVNPRIMDRTRDALIRNIHGRVIDERDIVVGAAKGREFHAEGADVMMAARLILSGPRLYQIVVIGKSDSITAPDVETFLSSFRPSSSRESR